MFIFWCMSADRGFLFHMSVLSLNWQKVEYKHTFWQWYDHIWLTCNIISQWIVLGTWQKWKFIFNTALSNGRNFIDLYELLMPCERFTPKCFNFSEALIKHQTVWSTPPPPSPEHFAIGYVHNDNLATGFNIAFTIYSKTIIAGRMHAFQDLYKWKHCSDDFNALSEDQESNLLQWSPKLSDVNCNEMILFWAWMHSPTFHPRCTMTRGDKSQ